VRVLSVVSHDGDDMSSQKPRSFYHTIGDLMIPFVKKAADMSDVE
jgi:hypothetical protein